MKYNDEGNLSVKEVIGVVILVIIALLMLPLVIDAVDDAQALENVTGTQDTLLDMVPIFYILGVVLAAVAWVIKETGGLGGK